LRAWAPPAALRPSGPRRRRRASHPRGPPHRLSAATNQRQAHELSRDRYALYDQLPAWIAAIVPRPHQTALGSSHSLAFHGPDDHGRPRRQCCRPRVALTNHRRTRDLPQRPRDDGSDREQGHGWPKSPLTPRVRYQKTRRVTPDHALDALVDRVRARSASQP
jgi:hypothetical protein